MSRVSSDEQALGYSLGIQKENLLTYCQKNDLDVIYEFKEDHSAKNFNRPAFNEFLLYLKKNKGKIDILLFTSWDRFSRNIMDALIMIDKLKQLGVTVRAIEQPIDLTVPENLMMLAMYLVIPEIDNSRRSIKIKGGIRAALKAGRWPFNAPLGYRNTRDEKNKTNIIHTKDAPHIKCAFEKCSTGTSQVELLLFLKKKGIRISRSYLSALLRNKVYAGFINIPESGDEFAETIRGLHEPIITEALFNKVQKLLVDNIVKKNKPKFSSKRMELPLRGNLICSKCRNHLTGSASRSQNGKLHFYYHCNACGGDRIKAETINESVIEILASLKFKNSINNLFESILKERFKDKKIVVQSSKQNSVKRLSELNSRIIKLQDMLADGNITSDDFREMKKRYIDEKNKIEETAKCDDGIDIDTNQKLLKSVKALSRLDILYRDASLNNKQKIIGSIFPEKLFFAKKKCRTTRINEVVRLGLLTDKGFRRNKFKIISQKLVLSCQVENTGIEPVTSCMPCKRSSQLS